MSWEERSYRNLQRLGPEARDQQVGDLQRPWIGQEGPMEAQFIHAKDETPDLLLRGLAFDGRTTVFWDEDSVRVIQPALGGEEGVISLANGVVVRDRQEFKRGPGDLERIDYLYRGVLLGSHYQRKTDSGGEAEDA